MIHNQHIAEGAATISLGSTAVSFFVDTLPIIQWMAAFVAVVSGLTATAWVCYKFYKAHIR